MPLVYDPDTGEWIIDRSSSVSEDYGLSGDRKLTTAMSPDELDKRLGVLDRPGIETFGDEPVAYGLEAPQSWDEFQADWGDTDAYKDRMSFSPAEVEGLPSTSPEEFPLEHELAAKRSKGRAWNIPGEEGGGASLDLEYILNPNAGKTTLQYPEGEPEGFYYDRAAGQWISEENVLDYTGAGGRVVEAAEAIRPPLFEEGDYPEGMDTDDYKSYNVIEPLGRQPLARTKGEMYMGMPSYGMEGAQLRTFIPGSEEWKKEQTRIKTTEARGRVERLRKKKAEDAKAVGEVVAKRVHDKMIEENLSAAEAAKTLAKEQELFEKQLGPSEGDQYMYGGMEEFVGEPSEIPGAEGAVGRGSILTKDEQIQQILDRGAAGEELTDEDLDKLAAETESELVAKVELPEDPDEPAPPKEAPTGEQNLVLTGLRVKTGKDRTYPIVGSANEVASFAAFDLQALSKADPMLKDRSKTGGIRITDSNRTIEEQLEQHPEQSREVAARQPHVLGLAIDVDVRGSSTSPEFQFMKANAYKACYYWPAVKRKDGSVEYHHWQHDCAAAKAQAKEWGFDESLTGTLATSYDRYQKGELTQEYMTRAREPGTIDWSLMYSPEDEGKIWPSDRPKNHVWSEAHGKYIHLNPNMSSKDLKSLSDQYRLEMGRLYPDNELKAQEAHTKFLSQIGSEIGKLSGQWYTTNERLNEQKQQITKAGETAALKIADHKKKSALAKSLAADAVVETNKKLNEKSQALMAKMQESITKHEEFLANAEPDQFRLFGMFNKDGSFSASKLAFTLVAVPALILNLAASLGSKGKNRVPFLLWDMVSKAMDNDVQAQRDAITNNLNAFNAKKTSFGYWNDFFNDQSIAAQKTYTDMLQASTAKLKALEAAQKDPFARLAISQAVQIGQQEHRQSQMKFLGMIEQWARRKQDHSQKIIGQQQAVEVNAWKTRFDIFSKIMEENASGKTIKDLPGPLQRIYFGAKGLLPKIKEARELWMRSGRDEKSGMILKLIAGMDPETFTSKVFRLPPMPRAISAILGTNVQVYEDLMRLNHLRHTMRATTSKTSGNVGNDNAGEQVAGMWNWPMEEGYRQGMLYLDKFEANARMMSSLAFYFQPGLEETKQQVYARTGLTENYKGSSAYNTLLGKLGELQAKNDQQGQIDLIKAFTVEQHSLTMRGQNPQLPESTVGVGTPRKKRPSIQGRKGGYKG